LKEIQRELAELEEQRIRKTRLVPEKVLRLL